MAISDRRLLADTDALTWLGELAAAGVDAVQVREKDLADRALLDLSARWTAARRRPPAVLINSRADVALAAGATGVHLPGDGVPVAALRRRFGELLVGRSTHHPDEVRAARREGADFVTFGPVFDTPSKRAYGPPPGLEGLRRAVAVGLPVLALGGVGAGELAAVAAAGAAGMAGIRVFHDAPSLRRLAAARRAVWS